MGVGVAETIIVVLMGLAVGGGVVALVLYSRKTGMREKAELKRRKREEERAFKKRNKK
jgi:Na+-driven multidrug efflux pump